MKLLNSFGPNPRKVRMYMYEKGLELPLVDIDLFGGENRRPPYTERNPGGQIPSLELNDGSVIAETVAICEYLEEKHPSPPLIGATPEQRAETRMWIRRIELGITEFVYAGFRYAEGLQLFQNRLLCLPEAADGMKQKGRAGMEWIDPLLEGKAYICGDRFSLADIVLYCALDFGISVGQPIPDGLDNLKAWFKRIDSRPSASATIAPNWKELGMRV
jgi:glutathione S-transferase